MQLSQSAYFALQCPYTVFGLGRTPNFVDKLTVGMPRSSDAVRTRDFLILFQQLSDNMEDHEVQILPLNLVEASKLFLIFITQSGKKSFSSAAVISGHHTTPVGEEHCVTNTNNGCIGD